MSYIIDSLDTPNRVMAGESFTVALRFCCTVENVVGETSRCDSANVTLTLDGQTIISQGVRLVAQQCSDFGVRNPQVDVDYIQARDRGSMSIDAPGTYTFQATAGVATMTKQIVVEEETVGFTPNNLSITDCAAPEQVANPGDTVTLSAVVQNDNEQAAEATLRWSVGVASFSATGVVDAGSAGTVNLALTLTDERITNMLGASPGLDFGGHTFRQEVNIDTATVA